MNNIIPFRKPEDKCSFCGTVRSKCKHLFSNQQGHFICNLCVAHAKKRLDEETAKESL